MFILGSGSPRRQELLKLLIDDFKVVASSYDESFFKGVKDKKDLTHEEAKAKAYALIEKYPDDEILTCDTAVILGNEALGKPKNYKDAFLMLKSEQNQKQIVLTSYVYLSKDRQIERTVRSEVYFNKLSDQEIKEYLETYKPYDKAGAYGIQDDFRLINKIVGSFFNVMGLPLEDLAKRVFKKEFILPKNNPYNVLLTRYLKRS